MENISKIILPNEDRHHIFYERPCWRTNKYGSALRGNRAFIVPLDVNIHRELHANVDKVPLLGGVALKGACEYFFDELKIDPLVSPVDAINSMVYFLERIKKSNIKQIEKTICDQVLENLESQAIYIKPYIKEKRVGLLNQHFSTKPKYKDRR